MKEKMIRTQVYLPRDIYSKLKKRANEEDISMAHQIREALITERCGNRSGDRRHGSKYSFLTSRFNLGHDRHEYKWPCRWIAAPQ